MNNQPKHPFYFGYGLSKGVDEFTVIAQIEALKEVGSLDSEIMTWKEGGGWSGFTVPWAVTSLAQVGCNKEMLMGTGPAGIVFIRKDGQVIEEMIDDTDDGPRYRGDVRAFSNIGESIYAAGMSRQVYKRQRPNEWERCDEGVVQARGEFEVVGFNSIHGLTEELVHAAGYSGEIWYLEDSTWQKIVSPTNVLLSKVLEVAPGRVFICGQKGVVLKGGRDSWSLIDNGLTNDHFWGMAALHGRVFLSTDSHIYMINDNDELKLVDWPLGAGWTFRHLHCSGDTMYSFGVRHIASTQDGLTWRDQTPN